VDFAIVDIETTGSYIGANSITEIAILRHNGKRVTDRFESLVNPDSTISPYVSRLTGITNEMVSKAPRFHELAKKIWDITEGAVFVAHSVNFDYSFIREEFKSFGADFKRKKLCTIRLSRKIFPGHSSYSLGTLCSTLGIDIQNRHRAMGDALATVKLFEMCMENDKDDSLRLILGKNSAEAILPPALKREVFDSLPEKTGVYYFHDSKGKVIYVGKAVNIKKRIYSHFTSARSLKISFTSAIADITYQLCGSELIALLLESDEIQRLYPLYNQTQKHDRGNYILCEYHDQRGIHNIRCTKNHKTLAPLTTFRSFEAGRELVFKLIAEYDLCPKFCGVQQSPSACYDYQMKKCKGVCAGKEDINEYNNRVANALDSLGLQPQTKIIIGDGRTIDEKSIVLVEKGTYKGYGFTSITEKIDSLEKAQKVIMPFRHTGDVQRILNGIDDDEFVILPF
jgi:DNA polymerase III subunit epsilon